MKLVCLTIHNIASIPDATIDFASGPLASCEVFLISGVTGAGKSVILDSICLALFANIPRLKRSEMTKSGSNDETSPTDVRQFMRQGTSECFVELEFVANNGRNYRVRWEVHRAKSRKGNILGKLQTAQWSLECLSDPKIAPINGVKAMKNAIPALIGLDFNQFCRTTMLCQGDFTSFLIAGDNDKADILEKITGKTIFAELGATIYRITDQKKKAYQELAMRIGDVKLLSEEELSKLHSQSNELATQINTLDRELKNLQAAKEWFGKDSELKAQLEEAQKLHQSRALVIDSEEFNNDQLMVNRRKHSSEARVALAALKVVNLQIEAAKREIDDIRLETARFEAARRKLMENLEAKNSEHTRLTAEINSLQERATLFGHNDQVVALLTTIISAMATVAQTNQRLLKQKSSLPDLQKERSARVEQHEAARKAVTDANRRVADLDAQIEALDLTDLNKSKTGLGNKKQELEKILGAIADIGRLEESLVEDLKTIEISRQQIDSSNIELAELKEKISEFEGKLSDAQRLYDLAEASEREQANDMRRLLSPGCTCPVCRQKVEEIIAPDPKMESALRRELRERVETITTQLQHFTKQYNDISINLEATRKIAGKLLSLSAEKQEKLEADRKITDERLAALNLQPHQIESEIAAITYRLAEIESKVRQIVILQNARKAEALQQLKFVKTATQAAERLSEAETKIKRAESAIDEQTRTIEKARLDISESFSQLDKLPGISAWNREKDEEPTLFRESFVAEQKAYSALVDRRDRALSEADKLAMTLQQLDTTRAALPHWELIEPCEPPHTDPHSLIIGLVGRYNAALRKLDDNKLQLSEQQGVIDRFMSENPDFSIEEIAGLNAIDDARVEATEKRIRQELERLRQAAENIVALTGAINEHAGKKPENLEELSVNEISARLEVIATSQADMLRAQGSINQKLIADGEARKTVDSLLEQKIEAEKEKQRWEKVCARFGDQRGVTFKRIALSFILADLIRKANGYLRQLTPRYSLHIEPGSYNIDIIDSEIGSLSRSANTSSGGESFLFSLALALALSDISPRLAVDTLFIDEGFGTLSGEPLRKAVALLQRLQHNIGRRVGVISHIEAVAAEIPVQIKVEKNASTGASTVTVVSL